jgi:hypothetical protein
MEMPIKSITAKEPLPKAPRSLVGDQVHSTAPFKSASAPERHQQRDRIMPGPHRSMHNISNLRQQSAGEGGEQEEDYRSCRRRRRNVCHGRIYANRVFFLRLHMDVVHGVSQRIDGDLAEDGRGLEEMNLNQVATHAGTPGP